MYDKDQVSDSTAVMIVVLMLFLAPAKRPTFTNYNTLPKILDWEDMKKLPWGILLLLGGGFALADAFKVKVRIGCQWCVKRAARHRGSQRPSETS